MTTAFVLAGATAYGRHRVVRVDLLGRLGLDDWSMAVSAPGVACAALQVADHEVGTRQPYAEATAAADRAGVPVVLATTALGRLDLSRTGGWAVLTGERRGGGRDGQCPRHPVRVQLSGSAAHGLTQGTPVDLDLDATRLLVTAA